MYTFSTEAGVNAISLSRDNLMVAAAGRSLLKVYSLQPPSKQVKFGAELYNLRSSNLKNLNFSNNDVCWSPISDNILATAATNGAVIVWNLMHQGKSKIEHLFNDHKRTVNKVTFHPTDPNLLLSGSQDGMMKLFDLRQRLASSTFITHSESVRDCQFAPISYSPHHFASVQETGNVEVWDIRRPDRAEMNFIAHDEPIFSCEWHPTQDKDTKWLATGGRDKTIKVWDLSNRSRPILKHDVHTIALVSKLKWRPGHVHQIGSGSLTVDFNVYVWDIYRPYLSYAIFKTRNEATTGFQWKSSDTFITACKDGTIYQHSFETDAFYTAEHYSPLSVDINPSGDVCLAMSDFVYRYGAGITGDSNPEKIRHMRIEETKRRKRAERRRRRKEDKFFQSRMHKAASMAKVSKDGELGNGTPPTSGARTLSEGDSNRRAADDSLLSSSFTETTLATSFHDFKIYDNKMSAKELKKKKTSVPALSSTVGTSATGSNTATPLANHHHRPTLPYCPTERTINPQLYPTSDFKIHDSIDYRRGAAKILQEHFRSTFSLMLHFSGENESKYNFLSMKPFIYLARNYRFVVKASKVLHKKETNNEESAKDDLDKDTSANGSGDNKKAREDSSKINKKEEESDNDKGEDTFENVCEHNAKLNEMIQNHQVAYSWRILRSLFAPPERKTLACTVAMMTAMATSSKRYHETSGSEQARVDRSIGDRILSGAHHASEGSAQLTSSGKETEENMEKSTPAPGGGAGAFANDIPSRHASGGGAIRTTHPSALVTTTRNENEEDDEEMMQIFSENIRFKPVIQPPIGPPNKFACDFFDCQEIIDNSMDRETLDQENRNEFEGNYYHNWELRHEAITHRHALVHDMNGPSKFGHNPSGGDYGGAVGGAAGVASAVDVRPDSPASFDGDDDEVVATPAPKSDGFELNMRYLINIERMETPAWLYSSIVADVLTQMADQGNLQTVVTMIIVLGDRMMDVPVKKELIVVWFRTYLDMLARFELWNVHNHVMRLCRWSLEGEEALQLRNSVDTTIVVHCVQCQKPLKKANSCRTCRLDSNACCLCDKPVRGLYVWCQGCTHGGHLQHMVEWFKQSAYCPSGCGHACEFN